MAKQTKKPQKRVVQKQFDQHIRHRFIVGIGIVIIAVLLGLVLSLVILPRVENGIRLQRINAIYSSIKVPENTYFNTQDIFGDKRPYEYDATRTTASVKTFVVAKTVNETASLMDTAIREAGYTFIEESYPGATSKEYHYKTDKGEYIRLNVSSKSRNDTASNQILMNGKFSDDFYTFDPNTGPSTVILKVNLDDNNE